MTRKKELGNLENEVKRLKLTNETIQLLTERNNQLVNQLRLAADSRNDVERERDALRTELLQAAFEHKRNDQELESTKTMLHRVNSEFNTSKEQMQATQLNEERLKLRLKDLEGKLEAEIALRNRPLPETETQKEVKQLRTEVTRLNDVIRKKVSQISVCQIVEERLGLENSKLKQVIETKDAEIKDHISRDTEAQALIDNLSKNDSAMSAMLKMKEADIQKLTDTNQRVEEALNHHAVVLDSIKRSLVRALKSDDRFCNNIAGEKTTISALALSDIQEMMTHMMEEFVASKQNHMKDVQQLNECISDAYSRKMKYKATLTDSIGKMMSMNEVVKKLKDENDDLKANLSSKTEAIEMLEKNQLELHEESLQKASRANEEIIDLRLQIEELTKALVLTNNNLEACKEDYKIALESQVDSVRAEKSKLKTELNRAGKERKDLREKSEALKKKLTSAEQKQRETEKLVLATSQENSQLDSMVTKLKVELEKVSKDLVTKKAECRKLAADLSNLETEKLDEIKAKDEEIRKITADAEEIKSVAASQAKSASDSIRDNQEKSLKKISKLKESILSKKEIIRRLEAQLAKSKRELKAVASHQEPVPVTTAGALTDAAGHQDHQLEDQNKPNSFVSSDPVEAVVSVHAGEENCRSAIEGKSVDNRPDDALTVGTVLASPRKVVGTALEDSLVVPEDDDDIEVVFSNAVQRSASTPADQVLKLESEISQLDADDFTQNKLGDTDEAEMAADITVPASPEANDDPKEGEAEMILSLESEISLLVDEIEAELV